jgi:hypothetical protein
MTTVSQGLSSQYALYSVTLPSYPIPSPMSLVSYPKPLPIYSPLPFF